MSVDTDDGAGVESVETITEPPDELVADKMQQNEYFVVMQKNNSNNNGNGNPSTVTSTKTTAISTKIHLQEQIKKLTQH